MTDSSDAALQAWIKHLQRLPDSVKAREETSEEQTRRQALFSQLLGTKDTPGADPKSRLLDSPEMESLHGVDHLKKNRDGVTVVRYYFPHDAEEATALSRNDVLFHQGTIPFTDDVSRTLPREVMKEIVAESGARIEFQEVSSLSQADLSFVKSGGAIAKDGKQIEGYAGRSGEKNYVVDAADGLRFKQLMQGVFDEMPSAEQEKIRERILQAYGDKYGKDADIFTILASEREKMVLAHEIEHTLGAGHPDETIGAPISRETIMADPVLSLGQKNQLGKLLEGLDIEWYQRHYGVKDLPESALLTPEHLRKGNPDQSRKR